MKKLSKININSLYVNSILALVISFMSYSVIQAQTLSGDSWAEVKAKGSGTITLTYVKTPGFIYKDNSGNLTGICIDIMNDFIKFLEENKGVKVNKKMVGNGSSFKVMYDGAKFGKGGVFGLGNITITAERKSKISFSPAFINNFAILITQSSVATLKDMKNIGTAFRGMTAYAAKGTLNEKRILEIKSNYYSDLKINYASSSSETLEKVLADKNSFSYLDLAFYLDAINKKQPIKRHGIGDKSSEEFGFIMPLGSDWRPVMEEFFAFNGGYKNSSAYKKILIKHLGTHAVKLIASTNQ